MKYQIAWTAQFKDYKLAMKRHLDIELIDAIIKKLANGEELQSRTGITVCLETGKDIGNAILRRIGFWSIGMTMMSLCSR